MMHEDNWMLQLSNYGIAYNTIVLRKLNRSDLF